MLLIFFTSLRRVNLTGPWAFHRAALGGKKWKLARFLTTQVVLKKTRHGQLVNLGGNKKSEDIPGLSHSWQADRQCAPQEVSEDPRGTSPWGSYQEINKGLNLGCGICFVLAPSDWFYPPLSQFTLAYLWACFGGWKLSSWAMSVPPSRSHLVQMLTQDAWNNLHVLFSGTLSAAPEAAVLFCFFLLHSSF